MTKITIKGFLAWVQQQPGSKAYVYESPTTCPLSQYVAASYPKPAFVIAGTTSVTVYSGFERMLDTKIDQRLNEVPSNGDQTFGSLEKRLRTLL